MLEVERFNSVISVTAAHLAMAHSSSRLGDLVLNQATAVRIRHALRNDPLCYPRGRRRDHGQFELVELDLKS